MTKSLIIRFEDKIKKGRLGDKVDIDEETGHIRPAKIDAEADGEVTAILTRVNPPVTDVHVAFTEKGWKRFAAAKPFVEVGSE